MSKDKKGNYEDLSYKTNRKVVLENLIPILFTEYLTFLTKQQTQIVTYTFLNCENDSILAVRKIFSQLVISLSPIESQTPGLLPQSQISVLGDVVVQLSDLVYFRTTMLAVYQTSN